MVRVEVHALAANLVLKSSDRLRIAFGEQDQSKEPQLEARHFLKWNERRMGHDFEFYNSLAQVGGQGLVLATLLQELVLPLKGHSPDSFKIGIDFLRMHNFLFERAERGDWCKLLDALSV